MRNIRLLSRACIAAVLIGLAGTASALGDSMDCSYSKKSKKETSREVIKPGDRPDREFVQYVRVDALSSKNPEFDGTEQTVYAHTDTIAGTGTHSGYAMTVLKSGEKLWSRFEGLGYPVAHGDSMEVRFYGVFYFIAGTGKYKAIRGSGHYEGSVTAAGVTQETVCSASY